MKLEYEPGTLADRRLDYIEQWARQMASEPIVGEFTSRQRRVVASLLWWREVCRSNEHMGVRQQPKPIVGRDAKGRPVVQGYDRDHPNLLKMWALTKEGDPADIYEPVISLKTGERVKLPKQISDMYHKESRY